MTAKLRIAALLLACLAGPALAQTTTLSPAPGRPSAITAPAPAARATPPASSVAHPAAPAPTPAASAPATAPAPTRTQTASTGSRIDINSATEAQLDTLPGIGQVRAKAIIAGRPWDDLSDLVKKGAVPQAVLDGMKDRVALADINRSSAADMAKTLPGIGDARARAIVAGRPYASPQDLVSKKVVTQAVYDKLKDLVTY